MTQFDAYEKVLKRVIDRSIENRRRELSRHYKLVAEQRLLSHGHRSASRWGSTMSRLARSVNTQFLNHYFANPPRWRLRIRNRFGGVRTLPDFCIVGPIKSGTSDLAVSVMLHPNVIAPFAKEFWSPSPENWRIFYPTEKEKKRHAERFGAALSVYCVPALHAPEIAYNFSRVKPDAKIVLVLRNPVDRLFSQWKWEVFLAGEKRVSRHPFLGTFRSYVNTALELFPDANLPSICGFPALQTSIYWQSVDYWIKSFGSENILVLDAAEYFRDRSECLQRVQKFVGLPTNEIPSFAETVNENPLRLPPPDSESLARLSQFFAPFNEKLWTVIGKSYAW